MQENREQTLSQNNKSVGLCCFLQVLKSDSELRLSSYMVAQGTDSQNQHFVRKNSEKLPRNNSPDEGIHTSGGSGFR